MWEKWRAFFVLLLVVTPLLAAISLYVGCAIRSNAEIRVSVIVLIVLLWFLVGVMFFPFLMYLAGGGG
jgi:hypothetical protein